MLQFPALIYNVSGAATLLSIIEIKEISRTKAILLSEMYEEEDNFFFSEGHQDEMLFVLLNQCVK